MRAPPAASAALSRHATRVGGLTVTELVPFDLIVVGVPRRSVRQYAKTVQDARRLAADRLMVSVDRVRLCPPPYRLVTGSR